MTSTIVWVESSTIHRTASKIQRPKLNSWRGNFTWTRNLSQQQLPGCDVVTNWLIQLHFCRKNSYGRLKCALFCLENFSLVSLLFCWRVQDSPVSWKDISTTNHTTETNGVDVDRDTGPEIFVQMKFLGKKAERNLITIVPHPRRGLGWCSLCSGSLRTKFPQTRNRQITDIMTRTSRKVGTTQKSN